MSIVPETRYAKAPDGLNLAYQVVGDGPLDLVFISEWTTHVEAQWDYPPLARFLDRLATFSRLIMFDKRGIGLSDPLPLDDVPTLERGVEDISVVLDEVGSARPALFATAGAGPMSMVFAAIHPDRVRALALADTFARLAAAPDYPHGVSAEQQEAYLSTVERDWGTGGVVEHFAPSRQNDTAFRTWLGRYRRMAASPGMGRRMQERFYDTDVRDVLPIIAVPTLVMHHVGNAFVPVSAGRYLSACIAGSRFVELEGDEHLFYAGQTGPMLDEVEQFLTGSRQPHATNRVLATVLFTDIVDSTGTAGRIGDAAWRDLLESHDSHARRQLERFRGREIATTGDGFLATFDTPAPAVHAATAIREGARRLGLETRAGVHAGEVELRGTELGGVAVHLAQRVLTAAAPGEILVSSTVRDLVTGSSLRFVDQGRHSLKGFEDPWQLYAVDL